MTGEATQPLPPLHLMQRVAGHVDTERFVLTGRQTAGEIAGALEAVGRPIESFDSILDFGCGCGRVLIALRMLELDANVVGVDQDAEAIAWVRENVPNVEVALGSKHPPLPFPDARFDLVYSHSVFTHLDEVLQDEWFGEIERLIRPGGVFVTTVHGDFVMSGVVRDRPEQAVEYRERRERDGIVFIGDDLPVEGMPDYYHSTLHAPWYVMHHWGQWFEILLYRERGALGFQDLIVMRKRQPGQLDILSGRRRGRVRLEPVTSSDLAR